MKKIYLTFLVIILTFSSVTLQSQTYTSSADTMIVAALGMINADSLQANVQALQDMGTRFMLAPNRKEVATWIMDKFSSFGISEVRLDSSLCYVSINWPPLIYDTTTWQYNVEARIEGNTIPDEEVVLVGHYDCAVQYSDPLILAPGADDNASGTAATLECARVIMEMGYQPEQTLIFLASAAEELMYYGDAGTEHYAEEAQAAGRDITMAINNDMIAWNDGSWTLTLFNHILSPQITGLAIEIIENYTSLNYDSFEPVYDVGGDIQPFLDAGYNGIYFMEVPINPNYHQVTDLIDYCDFLYLAEATKVSLGCILHADMTVGQKELVPAFKEIEVYPNPASAEISFRIKDPGSSWWELKIADMNGAEVYKGQYPPGDNRLDVSFLADGFYMMIFRNGEEIRYKKLVIDKN
jgi:hypothetical protein